MQYVEDLRNETSLPGFRGSLPSRHCHVFLIPILEPGLHHAGFCGEQPGLTGQDALGSGWALFLLPYGPREGLWTEKFLLS